MGKHAADQKTGASFVKKSMAGGALVSFALAPMVLFPAASFATTTCDDLISGVASSVAKATLLPNSVCEVTFFQDVSGVEIPSWVTKLSVVAIGGGGGSIASAAGYAGGGGQFFADDSLDLTERTLDVTVGAAGANYAASPAVTASDGGDSSVTADDGSNTLLLSATGGRKGSSGSADSANRLNLRFADNTLLFSPRVFGNGPVIGDSYSYPGAGTWGTADGAVGGPGITAGELYGYLDTVLWAEDSDALGAGISILGTEFGQGGSIVATTATDALVGSGRGADVADDASSISSAGSGLVIMRYEVAIVTFISNGGVGTMGLQAGGESSALTSNVFTRAGFTFAGWATNPDGTGTAYADGDSYGFSASDTLYAQWTPVSSLLTCDINQASLDFDRAFDFAAGAELNQTDGNGSSSLNIGANAVDDDSVHFFDLVTGCSTQIDARVTVTETVNVKSSAGSDRVDAIDDAQSTAGQNRYLATDGESDLAGDSYLGLRVEFLTGLTYAANSGTPVTLANVVMSTYDLDWYQYLDANNFDRYSLSTDTHLTVSAVDGGLTRFASLTGNGTDSGVEAETIGRATLEFDSVDSISFRLGQDDPSPDTASYYLDFSTGESWAGVQAAAAAPPSVAAAPYTGPLLQEFSSRTLDVCTPKSITITGVRLSGVTASVQGKPVTVLENTATKLVLAFPAGLTPGNNADLVINSSSGTLTHQDAFDIPADTCAAELSKGRWTQLQSDGKTVKMYAKDPIGDGKIQFFVDGEEIAWVNAVDESDPKLSFASSYPYLVRSVELKPGKNRFEIKLDGVRVWRATYVPKG